MDRYWKAWGGLAGATLGVLAVHGVIPEATVPSVQTAIEILLPIIGGGFGAFVAPKNKY